MLEALAETCAVPVPKGMGVYWTWQVGAGVMPSAQAVGMPGTGRMSQV